jgi:hypothetical protein
MQVDWKLITSKVPFRDYTPPGFPLEQVVLGQEIDALLYPLHPRRTVQDLHIQEFRAVNQS